MVGGEGVDEVGGADGGSGVDAGGAGVVVGLILLFAIDPVEEDGEEITS